VIGEDLYNAVCKKREQELLNWKEINHWGVGNPHTTKRSGKVCEVNS
jgi:hypothetical protein